MYKDATMMHKMASMDKSENTIDATIGVLLDDDKNLIYSKVFNDALSNITNNSYNYIGVDGGVEFKNAIKSYFLVPSLYKVIGTSGATGALTLLLMMKKQKKNALVIPRLSWNNYENMAELYDYEVYYMDTVTLKYDTSVHEKYDNVVFIINTPASNPIGITYEKMLLDDFLKNAYSYNNTSVLFDLAYYHFEDNQTFLFDYGKNYNCYYALSLSKTLGVYGFRLGALLYNTDENFNKIARGVWSSISHISVNTFVKATSSIDLINKEVENNKLMLNKRTQYFKKLLDSESIDYYPFHNGFFITLKIDNPKELVEYLIQNHIYTLTTNNGVRIAVCSLNYQEIDQITKKIKEYYTNYLHK